MSILIYDYVGPTMGQKGVKFDLWPLAICKLKFLEIRHIAKFEPTNWF